MSKILYKSKKLDNILPIDNLDDYFILTDFDKTITKKNSMTSWSILAKSDMVPKTYIAERNALYDKYRPIELDESMEPSIRSNLIKEWFQKHIELFVKYKISENLFKDAAANKDIMEFRPGVIKFMEYLNAHKVPLIIISAGLGNFIESFLKENNCYFDNVFIASNLIEFENGIASGVSKNIIHSLNKNEVSLPDDIKEKIKDRKNVIVMGDQISDLKMVNEDNHQNVIKVGFLTDENRDQKELYMEAFDILNDEDGDYIELMNVLFRKKD